MIKTNKDGSESENSAHLLNCAAWRCNEENNLNSLQTPTNSDRLIQKIKVWNEQVLPQGWSIQMPSDFSRRPALQRGYAILQNSGSVIVGMSLRNSYFSPENVSRLFRFLHSLKVEVHIVVMDKPSEHNYRALGYSEKRILEKTKMHGAKVFRAVHSALKQIDNPGHFHILNWDTIRKEKDYPHARETLNSLYSSNEYFRNDLRSAVSAYLTPKLKGATMTEERHASADQYLLEELAFLICGRGHEESAYLYHKEWPIFERLISGVYDQNLRTSLGFVELGVRFTTD